MCSNINICSNINSHNYRYNNIFSNSNNTCATTATTTSTEASMSLTLEPGRTAPVKNAKRFFSLFVFFCRPKKQKLTTFVLLPGRRLATMSHTSLHSWASLFFLAWAAFDKQLQRPCLISRYVDSHNENDWYSGWITWLFTILIECLQWMLTHQSLGCIRHMRLLLTISA